MPGQAYRDRGRADAAPRAGHGDYPPTIRLRYGGWPSDNHGGEKSQDLIAGQWLCQIFDRTHVAGHFAVEIQAGSLTHDKHVDIRLHHLRQIEQRAQRLVFAADVHSVPRH